MLSSLPMFETVTSTHLADCFRDLWKLEKGSQWDEINRRAERADGIPDTLVRAVSVEGMGRELGR